MEAFCFRFGGILLRGLLIFKNLHNALAGASRNQPPSGFSDILSSKVRTARLPAGACKGMCLETSRSIYRGRSRSSGCRRWTFFPLCISRLPLFCALILRTYDRIVDVTRTPVNRAHLHPTPLPDPVAQPCADRYRNKPERIKDAVQKAKADSAESHGAIKCQWKNCGETVITKRADLWKHLQDRHGVPEGGRVRCLWTGCSSDAVKTCSLVQHVKSHFKLRLKCPSCEP
ncbi:hypothetical protein B0H11DRAFT_2284853 [Mycena galericulata]|nr:hypothetical protein B0H11DRAFT_2284853 [Mycena galericulata]